MNDAAKALSQALEAALEPKLSQCPYPKVADANKRIAELEQQLFGEKSGTVFTRVRAANAHIAFLENQLEKKREMQLAAGIFPPKVSNPGASPEAGIVTAKASPLSRRECLAVLSALGKGPALFITSDDAAVRAEAVKQSAAAGVTLPGMPAAAVDASLSPHQRAMRSIRADLVAAALRDAKPRK